MTGSLGCVKEWFWFRHSKWSCRRRWWRTTGSRWKSSYCAIFRWCWFIWWMIRCTVCRETVRCKQEKDGYKTHNVVYLMLERLQMEILGNKLHRRKHCRSHPDLLHSVVYVLHRQILPKLHYTVFASLRRLETADVLRQGHRWCTLSYRSAQRIDSEEVMEGLARITLRQTMIYYWIGEELLPCGRRRA